MATSLQPSVAPGASGDGGYHSHDGPLYDDEDDAAYDFYSDSGGETSDDAAAAAGGGGGGQEPTVAAAAHGAPALLKNLQAVILKADESKTEYTELQRKLNALNR